MNKITKLIRNTIQAIAMLVILIAFIWAVVPLKVIIAGAIFLAALIILPVILFLIAAKYIGRDHESRLRANTARPQSNRRGYR